MQPSVVTAAPKKVSSRIAAAKKAFRKWYCVLKKGRIASCLGSDEGWADLQTAVEKTWR